MDEEFAEKNKYIAKMEAMIRKHKVQVTHVFDSSPAGLVESIDKAAKDSGADMVSKADAVGAMEHDRAGERGAGLGAAFVRARAGVALNPAGDVCDGSEEAGRLNWLGKMVVAADVEALHPHLRHRMRGQRDDGLCVSLLAQPQRGRVTIEHRHRNIHENEVVVAVHRFFNALGTVHHAVDGGAPTREQALDQELIVERIFHEQNFKPLENIVGHIFHRPQARASSGVGRGAGAA